MRDCSGSAGCKIKTMIRAVVILFAAMLTACGGQAFSTSISVSPKLVTFNASSQSGLLRQNVLVTYRGDGVVAGFAPGVSQPFWLGVNAISETANTVGFTLSVYPRGMSPGTYTVKLRFLTGVLPSGASSIEEATNISYVDLPITLVVAELSVSSSSVELSFVDGSNGTSSGTFRLNVDDADRWTARSTQSWLSVMPQAGTGPADISYAVDTTGLAPGTHQGIIQITNNFGVTVETTVTVAITAPLLTVSPATLAFTVGGDTSSAALSQTLNISDELGGANAAKALDWVVQGISAPWLSMTPTSGNSSPSDVATVTISRDSLASMPNGDYSANITLAYASEDGLSHTLNVPVVLHLNSPLARIDVTPVSSSAIQQTAAVQFIATAINSAGYTYVATQQVTWTSSSTVVAGVDVLGHVAPYAPGQTTISAAMPGTTIVGSSPFTVKKPAGYGYALCSGAASGIQAISQYIYGEDGVLTPMAFSAEVSAYEGVGPLVFLPSGDYAYASGQGTSTIVEYVVNQGLLTKVRTVPAAATGITEIAPSGKYLYSMSAANTDQFAVLSQFVIGSDGALTPMLPSTTSLDSYPRTFTIDPSGKYIYVAGSGSITRYAIGADGVLSRKEKIDTGFDPVQILVAPSNKYVYVLVRGGSFGEIWQYKVESGGLLTAMSPNKVGVAFQTNLVEQMALAPSERHLYVTDGYRQTVSHLTVDTDGQVSRAETIRGPYQPTAITFDSSGKFLYAAEFNKDFIYQYAVDLDSGVLTFLNTAAHTGDRPISLVVRKAN